MAVPLEWQLRIQGAEEVKTKLAQINQEFSNGQITATQFAKGIREVNRDSRSLAAVTSLNKNLFFAMHPQISAATKAMSSYSHSMRGALAVMNALNLSTLTQSVGMRNLRIEEAELSFEREQLIRKLDDMRKAGLEGTFAFAEMEDQLKLTNDKIKNVHQSIGEMATQDLITKITTIGTTIGLIGTSAINAIPHLKTLSTALKGVTGLSAATGLTAIGTPIGGKGGLSKGGIARGAAGAAGGTIFGLGLMGSAAFNPEATDQDKLLSTLGQAAGGALLGASFGGPTGAAIGGGAGLVSGIITNYQAELTAFIDYLQNDFGEQFMIFFTQTIPLTLGKAGQFIANFFTQQLPQWVSLGALSLFEGFKNGWIAMIQFSQDAINGALSAIEFFVNGIINIMNRVIEGLNKIPGISIPKIALVDLPKADFSNIISSLSNNQGAQQAVSLPNSNGGGSQQIINISNNFEGSLLAERDFENKVDKVIKDGLKEVGF